MRGKLCPSEKEDIFLCSGLSPSWPLAERRENAVPIGARNYIASYLLTS